MSCDLPLVLAVIVKQELSFLFVMKHDFVASKQNVMKMMNWNLLEMNVIFPLKCNVEFLFPFILGHCVRTSSDS